LRGDTRVRPRLRYTVCLPNPIRDQSREETPVRGPPRTEYLFVENIALKLVLEHRAVPNWQKLVEHLLSDKEMLAGVRLKFRDLYDKIEESGDPSEALEAFLGELPAQNAQKKTH